MTISKKQNIIVWTTTAFIVVLLGLESIEALDQSPIPAGTINTTSELFGKGLHGKSYLSLNLYGMEIFARKQNSSNVVLGLENYKYHLIIATLFIGLVGVLTSKKK